MRTDDDSWDITESVGATAIGVAAMRARETERPDALFRDPYAAKLVEAAGDGWGRIMRGEVSVDPEHSRLYGPMGGMMTARTVYFDEHFRAAATAGIRQMVILASGLDARAYRLEWPSSTVIFELDQPKVLEFKAAALADDAPAAQRRAIAIDLRQDWPAALRENGFDPSRPTAWLAEGLLRYLPNDAQDRLCENIVGLSAPRSRVALNISTGDGRPSPQAREARAKALAEAGIRIDVENLFYSSEGRADPREWFAERGWAVSTTHPLTVLNERGREVSEAARATFDRMTLMTAIRQGEQ